MLDWRATFGKMYFDVWVAYAGRLLMLLNQWLMIRNACLLNAMRKMSKHQSLEGLKTRHCSSVPRSRQTLQKSSSAWLECCEARLFVPMHLHWLLHYRYRSTPWGRLQTEIIPVVAGVVAILVPVLQVNPEGCVESLICLATEFFPLRSRWRCLCDSWIHLALSRHSAVPRNSHSCLCKALLLHTLFIRDEAAIAPHWNPWHLYATEVLFFFLLLRLPVAKDGKWPAYIQTCPQHHRHAGLHMYIYKNLGLPVYIFY